MPKVLKLIPGERLWAARRPGCYAETDLSFLGKSMNLVYLRRAHLLLATNG